MGGVAVAIEAEFIEAAKEGDATKIASLLKADPDLARAVGDHSKTASLGRGDGPC